MRVRLINTVRRFLDNCKGNVAVVTALMALPLCGAMGMTVDYASLYQTRITLQRAADAAAIGATRELGLANSQLEALNSAARNYVFANLGQVANLEKTKVAAQVSDDRRQMTVTVSHNWQPMLFQYIGDASTVIEVSATASLAGTAMICMIGLDEEKKEVIHLVRKAKLEASGCGVYANSSHEEAIRVENDASLISGVTCSAGGIKGAKQASFEPEALTDCPRVGDPLKDRAKPQVGLCDYDKVRYDKGEHVLEPGTYCGGLQIRKTAKVKLNPGIYIIKGGKLEVTDDAMFEGENVGFYLSGDKAKLVFKKRTTINLTAPKDGIMAGLLIFEDRSASRSEKHVITSDNARQLLGTIYLPNGTLRIDSDAPISDKAAYTAIIARAIELAEGPTLHLNSDYKATDVPVPEGLVDDDVRLLY